MNIDVVGYAEDSYHMSKFNNVVARCQSNERGIRPDHKDFAFAQFAAILYSRLTQTQQGFCLDAQVVAELSASCEPY